MQLDYSSLETLDYWPKLVLIALYSVIAFVSLILNSMTIAVLLAHKNIYSESTVYLINQSVSDIVMSLLCIPFTYTNFILNRWIFPHFMCPLVNFAQICSVLVSNWNLTAIGIERYLAITTHSNSLNQKHLSAKYQNQISNRKKLVSIGAIWLVAIGSGCVEIFFTQIVPFEFGNDTLFECRETIPEVYSQLYTIHLFLHSFGIPSLILIYVYSVIGYRVWRHVSLRTRHRSPNYDHMKKVSKMMLLIVLIFLVCWTPLHIFTLLARFVDSFLQISSTRDQYLLVYGYLVCHLLAMSHSFVNPLVYCCISRKFWVCIQF